MAQNSNSTKLITSLAFITILGFGMSGRCPIDDEFCLACANDKCTVCVAGYISANGVCQRVPKKIFRCILYDDNYRCLACKYGHFLDSDGKCYEIPDTNCMLYDSNQNCIMCTGKMRAKDGSCYNASEKCSTENCLNCMYFSDGVEKCHRCDEGFALSYRNGPVPECLATTELTQNCWVLSAVDENRCSICLYNYYFNKGICEKSMSYWIDMGSIALQIRLLVALVLTMLVLS